MNLSVLDFSEQENLCNKQEEARVSNTIHDQYHHINNSLHHIQKAIANMRNNSKLKKAQMAPKTIQPLQNGRQRN